MALNQIGQERFQRRLTRELEIGGDQPSPVLAPEIQPVLVLEGERPELLHLQGEHRFICTLTLAGVVAEYYYFHLWNPAGSGMLVTVEGVEVMNADADAWMDMGPAILTMKPSLAGRAAYCLDTRVPQNPLGRPGVAEPLVGTDVATGGIASFGRFGLPQYHSFWRRLDYTLSPGNGFGLFDPYQNESIYGYCIWRERVAKDGELT